MRRTIGSRGLVGIPWNSCVIAPRGDGAAMDQAAPNTPSAPATMQSTQMAESHFGRVPTTAAS
jgi:hypothetical protein